MQENNEKKYKFFKILIICFFIILGILLYSRYIETTNIKVKETNVINTNVPESFYGYKLVQLSDIHYKTTIGREELEKIVKKVNKIKPDILVITGDLLEKDTKYTKNDIENITKIMKNINCKYKYIISGDNDKNDAYDNIINNINFKLIDNNYEIIYNGNSESILIGGISTKKDSKNISEKISIIDGIANNSKYKILLIHEPSIVNDINTDNYDLILAGHTHLGQINIPGIRNIMIDKEDIKYNKEYTKLNNSDLYVSPGLGTSGFKGRLFNKPTINLYRLLNK